MVKLWSPEKQLFVEFKSSVEKELTTKEVEINKAWDKVEHKNINFGAPKEDNFITRKDAITRAVQDVKKAAELVAALPERDPRIPSRLEEDPSGKSAHTPGAKLDAGKNRMGLVLGDFSRALEQVGLVGTFGLKKYSASGWISVPAGVERYTDALYRHLNSEAQGEKMDEDSELPHAAHAAWNALARLDLMLRAKDTRNDSNT